MQNTKANRPLWVTILILAVLALVAVILLALLIQLIPYGKNHTNPPVVQEPNWDSPQTRELAARACFDCHSNETGWPWYSSIAPFSWLIQHDVDEGRQRLNFSEWGAAASGQSNRRERETREIGEVILEGEMPPAYYIPLHPVSRLTAAEKQALADGLTATLNR
jgi:hypothetical protein